MQPILYTYYYGNKTRAISVPPRQVYVVYAYENQGPGIPQYVSNENNVQL